MTISAIEISNFKGIAETIRVDLKPITLLFGANSAGKSTVLQALLYAREILARRNTDPDRTQLGGEQVDLGGFCNLVHDHERDRCVALWFELDLSNVDLVDYVELPRQVGSNASGERNADPRTGGIPAREEAIPPANFLLYIAT